MIKAILDLARPQQWTKNLLVFGAPFFSGQITDLRSLDYVAVVFLTFCLLSSAAYVFNDWRDLQADRHHPVKRERPLPSGRIGVGAAMALMSAIYAAVIVIGVFASFQPALWGLIAGYVICNAAYSLWLKHVPVVELFCVASGFVIRFFAGAVALQIKPSPWIVAAIAMATLLIVCSKRRSDIASGHDPNRIRRSLHGYNLAFLDSLVTGLSSGTLVVYLLFCVSDYAESRYGTYVLVTAIPVAMGLFRFQQIVIVEGRGDMPTDVILRDVFLFMTLSIFLLMFALLLYL